jgi:hypothetical protein
MHMLRPEQRSDSHLGLEVLVGRKSWTHDDDADGLRRMAVEVTKKRRNPKN